jgi:hypothetical protein
MPRLPGSSSGARDPGPTDPDFVNDRRKPREELRDPLTYVTVGEWYRDYRGYVPIQMAHGLDQYVKRTGATFAEAYAALRSAGAIIELD